MLRWFPLEELPVALHVFHELAGCEADLLEVLIELLLVQSKQALEALNEWNRTGGVE